MSDELAQQIEAAGFAKLAATGMTDPVIARRLRITVDGGRAYRAYRGISSDLAERREWMTKQLKKMSTEANFYKSTSGEIATLLGTTAPTLTSLLASSGIPAPRKARREIIVNLHDRGYSRSTIVSVFGCSEQLVRNLAR